MMKNTLILVVCSIVFIFMTGCAKEEPQASSRKLNIVASVYPVYEFAKAVAGESAQVQLLLPAGAQAHDWEPAAAEIKKLGAADIFFYNGGGMEPWVEKLFATRPEKKTVFVETGAGLFTLQETSGHSDPHIWLDPVLAQAQVVKIRDELIKIDPKSKAAYEKNADAYIDELKKLDGDYSKLALKTKGQPFVTMHAAFGYPAKSYGWQQIPLMGIAPHAEPSPAMIVQVMQTIRERKIKYIFVEPNAADGVMKAIADETDTQFLVLDTLEAPWEGHDGYTARMRVNMANLARSFMVEL